MYVWLYVFIGCTRACVCRFNGDVIFFFERKIYLNKPAKNKIYINT